MLINHVDFCEVIMNVERERRGVNEEKIGIIKIPTQDK